MCDDDDFLAHIAEPENPPPVTYKYLPPDRIDVIENQRIRFTQVLGTNDPFEVRKTFKSFAGPRFMKMMINQAAKQNVDEQIARAISEKTGKSIRDATALAPMLGEKLFGNNYREKMISKLVEEMSIFIPMALNAPNFASDFVENMFKDALILSLSEVWNSPLMWAHYANGWAGYVIGFRTDDEFFRPGGSQRNTLFPIRYFDGLAEEFLDDPYAAMFSKRADWGYEREWRKLLRSADMEFNIAVDSDTIYLKSFPPSSVEELIIGYKATPETIEAIRCLRDERYKNARLTIARPQRFVGDVVKEMFAYEGLDNHRE